MKMSIISICTSGLLVFVMSGCNDMESLKQKIRISSDRVVVEVAGRPQALGSDSIALRFERFAATSNFVASCEIENIPKVANEFILYLCVPLNANFELLNSSTVSTKCQIQTALIIGVLILRYLLGDLPKPSQKGAIFIWDLATLTRPVLSFRIKEKSIFLI